MTEPTERDREMRKAFVGDTFPGCSQIDVGDYNLDALDRLLAAAREEGRRDATERASRMLDVAAEYEALALVLAKFDTAPTAVTTSDLRGAIDRWAAAVREKERERCAKIADDCIFMVGRQQAAAIAAKIRRSE